MRIVLMGTGPFALPSFEALRNQDQHEIALVVTRPVQNTDVRSKTIANPIRAWAERLDLPLIDPVSINDQAAIEQVSRINADLLIVCDYGQILSAEALESARLGGVNLHGSLLPRHRGAAPVQWSILAGDAKTGTCAIHMSPKLDGGPVLAKIETPILSSESASELEARLSELGIQCCLKAVSMLTECETLGDCELLGEPQSNALVTRAPRLSKADGQLDFRYPARLIDRQVRGLQPWPGVFGMIQLESTKVLRVALGRVKPIKMTLDQCSELLQPFQSEGSDGNFEPGKIVSGTVWNGTLERLAKQTGAVPIHFPDMMVACRDRFLEIAELQPAGKKMMTAREFLAGYGRRKNLRFQMPSDTPSHALLEKMAKLDQLGGI